MFLNIVGVRKSFKNTTSKQRPFFPLEDKTLLWAYIGLKDRFDMLYTMETSPF
jgi:hypothetical protein